MRNLAEKAAALHKKNPRCHIKEDAQRGVYNAIRCLLFAFKDDIITYGYISSSLGSCNYPFLKAHFANNTFHLLAIRAMSRMLPSSGMPDSTNSSGRLSRKK